MINCDEILGLNRSNRSHVLDIWKIEKPLVYQIGGNDPEKLAKVAKKLEDAGADEVNINCGCPSPTVSAGAFGASLMLKPEQVLECC